MNDEFERGGDLPQENRDSSDASFSSKDEENIVQNFDADHGTDEDVFIDGEYHFRNSEIHEPAYSDAGYIPSDRAGAVPPRWRCAEQQRKASPRTRPLKRRKRLGAAAVICLCLACSLIGGLVGGNAVRSSLSNTEQSSQNDGPQIQVAATPTPGLTTNIVAPGSELSGSQIYALGCAQSVAITTEITTYNYFGQPTSSAVSGSGFVYSSNGYIITNYHVIESAAAGGYEVKVLFYDGTEYVATIIGYDADNDVAILKIDAENLNAVTFGNSDAMQVGEAVYAIGNPLGELSFTLTDGMISALDREITSYDSATGISKTINMFQISAAVNSGNSGGPVYNSRGEVIGIVTAKYSQSGVESLGFAIPINDALSIADDLITKGYVSGRASMGILQPRTLSSSVANYYGMPVGVYVTGLVEGGAAQNAGICIGDIIVAIDETSVASVSELKNELKNYTEGDTAKISIFRSGEYLDLDIIFDEYIPDDVAGGSQNAPNG